MPAEAVLRRRLWSRLHEPILLEESTASIRATFAEASESGHAGTPALAALAVLANATNIIPTDHRDQLLLACAPTRTLVNDTTNYLAALRHRLELVSAVGAAGGGNGV